MIQENGTAHACTKSIEWTQRKGNVASYWDWKCWWCLPASYQLLLLLWAVVFSCRENIDVFVRFVLCKCSTICYLGRTLFASLRCRALVGECILSCLMQGWLLLAVLCPRLMLDYKMLVLIKKGAQKGKSWKKNPLPKTNEGRKNAGRHVIEEGTVQSKALDRPERCESSPTRRGTAKRIQSILAHNMFRKSFGRAARFWGGDGNHNR